MKVGDRLATSRTRAIASASLQREARTRLRAAKSVPVGSPPGQSWRRPTLRPGTRDSARNTAPVHPMDSIQVCGLRPQRCARCRLDAVAGFGVASSHDGRACTAGVVWLALSAVAVAPVHGAPVPIGHAVAGAKL